MKKLDFSELSEEVFDPESLGAFNKIGAAVNILIEQNAALVKRDADRETAAEEDAVARANAETTKMADEWFAGIDKAHEKRFGAGDIASFEGKAETPEFKNRLALVGMAKSIQDGYRDAGRKVSSKEAMNSALLIIAKDDIAANERRKLTKKLKDREGDIAEKPGHKKTGSKTDSEVVASEQANIDSLLAKLGD